MKRILCIISLFLFVVACNSGGGGSSSSRELDVTVSGIFTNGQLVATSKTASTPSAIPMADNSHMLTGKLKEGSKVYELKGTYDATTGSYSITAASVDVVYSITGTIDNNGVVTSIAMSKSVNSGSWTNSNIDVTQGNVSISDPITEISATTLPDKWLGAWEQYWEGDSENGYDGYDVITVSPMNYVVISQKSGKFILDAYGIIYSVTKVSDTEYNAVIADCHDWGNSSFLCDPAETILFEELDSNTLKIGTEEVVRF